MARIHHLVQEIGCRQAVIGQNLTFKVLVWPWKWGQGHQNLITSFPCQIHELVQEIECRQGLFLVFIVWWPWKLGQVHQNLIKSFNYPNDTIYKVWPESMIQEIACRQAVFGQNLTFKVLVWPWKWGQGHQNLITSFSCQIHELVQEIECRQGLLLVFIVWWPWKLGQVHQNLIKSFNYPNDTIYKVWPESMVQEIACRQVVFGQNLTFKVLVWPWKWGQGHQNLITSYSHPNNVSVPVWLKIHPLVQKTECRQEATGMRMRTLTGSAPKAICPPPVRLGDIKSDKKIYKSYFSLKAWDIIPAA